MTPPTRPLTHPYDDLPSAALLLSASPLARPPTPPLARPHRPGHKTLPVALGYDALTPSPPPPPPIHTRTPLPHLRRASPYTPRRPPPVPGHKNKGLHRQTPKTAKPEATSPP
ncbi:uncharacterized protein LOC126991678 [Eriocheir sinensis]|uniref:uncharacterized protein LOC126991678 n=1 Tax=Eriocheir sinensis TaxID=95602 RepID=UPI0021C5A1B8|nr:uncharacterized protein LOC126991678 [Eriocheir sinensis]